MIGIKRLRTIAGAWDEWGLGGALTEIAGQIEWELREERDQWDSELCEAQMDKSRVTAVYLEMNKHVLGHEGMEDSPVARWARELCEALGGDVTDEDREAAEWVRKRGGLDHVRVEWRSRVPYDRYVRKRQSLLGHIAECETALGRRREIISKLTHRVSDLVNENAELRKRAMPEGCEWPRYESGELVEVGDDVVGPDYGERYKVASVEFHANGFTLHDKKGFSKWYESDERFERHAVPAADGETLEVGQTVWDTDAESDTPLTVVGVSSDLVRCEYAWKDGKTYRPCYPPDQLTHTKPEIDSWERIEEDADALVDAEINGKGSYNEANAYCNRRGLGEGTSFVLMAQDLVRRCRALAERERGE